ncbi:MAG: hypothetical protein FJZ01_20250 [Candidatus Sericytochromatia bacterium]|nr:hypothetical protein [Candidatus Tanganyikabacteria bacterium]
MSKIDNGGGSSLIGADGKVRSGWGLVEAPPVMPTDPGKLIEMKKYGDVEVPEGKPDAATLVPGGAVSQLPAGAGALPKLTLDELVSKLTNDPLDTLVKNSNYLYGEYQGLLADIKDPILKALLAKIFLALLSDPPDMNALTGLVEKLKTYVATRDFLEGKSNQVPPDVMRMLEQKYGDWNGIGKNVDPTKGTGPNGGRLLRETIKNMLEGNDQAAQKCYEDAQKTASPLVFDLNGDGKVGTTGVAGGKVFDLDGDGTLDKTAWAGPGDGVLAFDGDGDGAVGEDGTELFGNNTLVDGKKYANGFEALRALAAKHLGAEAVADGRLGAAELKALGEKTGLSMLVDGKRVSLEDLGITEISVGYAEAGLNRDEQGNEHRQVGEGFVRNGQQGAVNDVWFQYQAGAGEPKN